MVTNNHVRREADEIWTCTWTVWLRIANVATSTTEVSNSNNQSPTATDDTITGSVTEDRQQHKYQQPLQQQSLQHKQQFLTALLQIFPLIFTRIKTRLSSY